MKKFNLNLNIKNKSDILLFILFSNLLLIVMNYHEPWLDEAQAWLISRDVTFEELFNVVMHYEGHPPLWFLILMPFAKSGISFEIGLKLLNFIITIISVALIIFKAPFNKFYRYTIPFTYFLFYQYGVISRPYSIMMLGFFLSAMFFKKRYDNPLYLTASLMLLCSSSAYGIVISLGIVIFWIYDSIIRFHKSSVTIKTSRLLYVSWTLLLVFNIILIITIYPFKDTFAVNVYKHSWLENVIFMFFAAPMEALFTNNIYTDLDRFNNLYYVFIIIGGITANLIFIFIAKNHKKTGLFLIPYLIFSIFSSFVYFSSHHIGIIVLFYVFIIWCCLDEDIYDDYNKKINKDKKILKITTNIIATISIIVSIYWSITSSIYDYKYNYGNGRDLSEFIRYNNLEKYNIYVAWYPLSISDTGNEIHDYNLLCGLPALAYFNENIFSNFNEKRNDKCYLLHKINSNSNYIHDLISKNPPEVLLISNRIEYTFGKLINYDDFTLIKIIKSNMIWKDSNYEYEDYIYVRRDLLECYPEFKKFNYE